MNIHVHHMEVMDPTGHTTVTWNPADPQSVEAARHEFRRLIRERYEAFRMDVVTENGVVVEQKGARLTEFDPEAGKVIMFPQLAGG
jgi:hypothetical protein